MRKQIDQPTRPYEPQGAALQLLYCQDEQVLLEGPAGTGKTRALLEKINILATKYAGMRALLVRKTRESITQSILVAFEEDVVPMDWPILNGPSRAGRKSYRYPNGSELVIGGMDKSSKIMSTEYDLIAAFEARELNENDWEALLSRLRYGRMPYQQAIADTNPDMPMHWLNRRADMGLMTRILSRHKDNPTTTTDYLQRLSQLTGVNRQRLFLGNWAAADGLVYEQFDPAVHTIAPFTIPRHWRRIRSIDFGYNNPFVCQWWAIDNDGRMYLYRELYHTRRLVRQCAEQIRKLSRNEHIDITVSDHDSESRAALAALGVPNVPAYKNIRTGLQQVTDRLRPQGDDKPRLFLFKSALVERDHELLKASLPTCTQQEFASYRWPDKSAGSPVELPLDANNHGMDAMRYAVAQVDELGQSQLTIRVIDRAESKQTTQGTN